MIKLPSLEFHSPGTLEEVFALLATHGESARLMGGGTDLLPRLKRRNAECQHLIGLRQVEGLGEVSFDEGTGLAIGATALLAQVAELPAVGRHYPALAAAIDRLATPQVRNKAGVAGNLCNASPCADTATPLLAYGARVVIASAAGRREVGLADFIVGPGATVLEPGEVVERVLVPPPPEGLRSIFFKFSPRSKVDIAAVNLTLALTFDGERVDEAKLCLGTVAPTPMRAERAEGILTGQALDAQRIEEAAQAASRECQPITDFRASEEYKRRLVYVLTKRALETLSS